MPQKRAIYKERSDDPLGSKLFLTSYRVMRHADQILQEYQISFHTYLTLYYIDKIPRISMRELCDYLDISQSIVSRTVATLAEKGLLRRDTANDRRKSELVLTGEARRLLKKTSGRLHEVSFILRHQPDFRIALIDDQLDKVQQAVAVAKERPLLRSESSRDKGDSVIVRITSRVNGGRI